MVSSSRKYLTKFVLFLLIAAIVITAAVNLALNTVLTESKNALLKAASTSLARKITIETVVFLPPNFIIIKNASVLENGSAARKELVVIPTILIRFSLPGILSKRSLVISSVSFYNPRMNYLTFHDFLRDNFTRIVELIKQLPVQDVKIIIKKANLELAPKDDSLNFINADFSLTVKGSSVSGRGLLSEDTRPFSSRGTDNLKRLIRGIPLRYNFKGLLTNNGFSIENVEFISKNLYAKAWGDYAESVLQFKGFVFVDTLFNSHARQKESLTVKDSLLKRANRYAGVDLSRVNLYILDIDGKLNCILPRVQIERLTFTLNNNPISLKGSAVFSKPLSLDLTIFSDQSQSPKAQAENLKRIELRIKGDVENRVFKGNGILNFDFVKKKKANPPIERLKLGLQGWVLNFSEYPRLIMSLGELNLFCLTESNTYRIALDSLNAVIHLQNDKAKFAEFNSRVYDGFLRGWGRLDLDTFPPRIASTIWLKDVNANMLESLLIHFSKVFGKLSGKMYFSNYPFLSLKGGMSIQNGYLNNFEFFKWLADFFALDSLRRIDFDNASSNFTVDAEGANLHEMKIDSKDVDLSGYFNLGVNDLVSSKLSLAMTRDLISESAKFTRLLKLLDSNINSLNFKFQLSGILNTMNFMWLKSDLKKELQDAIPDFIERKIERSVEEAIESVSGKGQD